MAIQKVRFSVVAAVSISFLFGFADSGQAALVANESIRINFTDGFDDGANAFNFVTSANGGIASGSVIKSDSITIATGVSIATAGWSGAGFVASTPVVFPGTGMNLPDVAITGNAGTFTNQVTNFFFDVDGSSAPSLTISGLTDSEDLVYDVYVYASVANAGEETTTVSVNGGTGIASLRTVNTTGVVAPNYTNYVFSGVQLDASDNIVVDLSSDSGNNNALLNAAIIVARSTAPAPEPNTLLLAAIGINGLLVRRRKRAR